MALASGAALALLWWVASTPGGLQGRQAGLVAGAWVLVALGYGVRAVVSGVATRPYGLAALRSWKWAIPPLFGLLAAVSVVADLPLRARFALSRSAVERAVDAGAALAGSTKRVGLFEDARVLVEPDGVVVVLADGCGFRRAASVAVQPRSPNVGQSLAAPTAPGPITTLGGGWISFCQ